MLWLIYLNILDNSNNSGDSFEKEFELSKSKTFQNLFSNHS